MIPVQMLENILRDEARCKEVIRLAYELAFEDRLKGPDQGSLDFITERMKKLKEIFGQSE